MKRLLNDPVMNDTGWPINKKVKQETNLQSDNRGNGLKWHLSCYWHPIFDEIMALPTMALPMRVKPSVSAHGTHQSFQTRVQLISYKRHQQEGQKIELEPVCIDYQPRKQEWLRCTRLLSLQCALSLRDLLPLFGVWDHYSCGVHWAYKGC